MVEEYCLASLYSVLNSVAPIDSFVMYISLFLLQSTLLESPIAVEEVEEAIKSLKSHKRPGPDGFTVNYYKTFPYIPAS